MSFKFEIIEHKNYINLKLKGELIDKNQAQPLIDKIDEYIQNNIVYFIFDMHELKYLNSSGLNMLIQIFTKARNNNGEVVLYNLNKKINELILVTKLHTIFKITENQKEALKELNLK